MAGKAEELVHHTTSEQDAVPDVQTHLCHRCAVGEVPLEWYKDEQHIGYDKAGNRIVKKGKRDKVDALLARNDGSQVCQTDKLVEFVLRS